MLLRRGPSPQPSLSPFSLPITFPTLVCLCATDNGSLPGYCWSTNPSKKGFNVSKIAQTFNSLMLALGYPRYVAQGGDWGSIIARRLAQLYPENCVAIHVNMLFTLGTPRISQGSSSPSPSFSGNFMRGVVVDFRGMDMVEVGYVDWTCFVI